MKNNVTHIKQKSDWDCCIASIAMMTGQSYESVLKKFEELFPGASGLGLADPEIIELLRAFKANPIIIETVILDIPCILFLPSKNEEGSHAVFFCGKQIYDPNFKVKGKKYYPKNLPKKFPKGTQAVFNLKNPIAKKALKELEKKKNG
jgi:hypothetical protein